MDKPRRRAAGRPAGPPNSVAPVSAGEVQPVAPAGRGADEPAEAAAVPRDGPVEQAGQQPSAGQQHRRRQRPTRQAGSAEPTSVVDPAAVARAEKIADSDPTVDTPAPGGEPVGGQSRRQQSGPPAGREDRRRGESSVERSLRALVSTRTTQLPPDVAMRAREVAAPTHADLAAAEAELVIVRRYYVPPAPLATAGKATDQRSADSRSLQGKGRAAESRRGGRRPQRGTPG